MYSVYAAAYHINYRFLCKGDHITRFHGCKGKNYSPTHKGILKQKAWEAVYICDFFMILTVKHMIAGLPTH